MHYKQTCLLKNEHKVGNNAIGIKCIQEVKPSVIAHFAGKDQGYILIATTDESICVQASLK